MIKKVERGKEIRFEPQCIVDFGKIFYMKDRVFRAIYDKSASELYKELLSNGLLEESFSKGLIRTWISTEVDLDGAYLVLEHEKIDFFIFSGEMTDKMFYDAAVTFINVLKSLRRLGLILKDAHPRNITFQKGKPVFYDFASIIRSNNLSNNWLDEFYLTFAVPLKLANSRFSKFSKNYRMQHRYGVGFDIARTKYFKKLCFRELNKWKYLSSQIDKLIINIDRWIRNHPPKEQVGFWDSYGQNHHTTIDKPVTSKQHFVFEILQKYKPQSVIDFACNKGFYSFMAEQLGAKVIGFDYEQRSVDQSNLLGLNKNATFCQMDFTLPTPNFGWGLKGPSAFQRYKSDIGLALGLIHHICLTQNFPVKLFSENCSNFVNKGIILEFVYPEDIHIRDWKINYPDDYSIESIKKYFSDYFRDNIESEIYTNNGIKRKMLFFHNKY